MTLVELLRDEDARIGKHGRGGAGEKSASGLAADQIERLQCEVEHLRGSMARQGAEIERLRKFLRDLIRGGPS